jgi:hypothetical protein
MFTGIANGSNTITPRKTGYTFGPTGKTVAVSGTNVTEINYTGIDVRFHRCVHLPIILASGLMNPMSLSCG